MTPCYGTLLVLICSHATVASAQRWQFGVKGGLVRSDMVGVGAGEWRTTSHYALGAYARARLNPWIGLEGELLLVAKGALKSDTLGGLNREWEPRPLYLETPLLARFQLPLPLLRPILLVGVGLAFELRCYERSEIRGSTIPPRFDDCARRLTASESPEFLTLVGLATGTRIQWFAVELEVRYSRGLRDFSRSRYPQAANFPEYRNSALLVLLNLGVFTGAATR